MPAATRNPAPPTPTAYVVPDEIAQMIADRDASAAKYESVVADNPGKTEPQYRGLRAGVTKDVMTRDAKIVDALLADGGLDALTGSGFKPWKSPAGTTVKTTPATISDVDLIATLTAWTDKIKSLPAGFESVATTYDRDHVQPLLKIAKDRDTLTVKGTAVTLTADADNGTDTPDA